jgi:hypothetical protein
MPLFVILTLKAENSYDSNFQRAPLYITAGGLIGIDSEESFYLEGNAGLSVTLSEHFSLGFRMSIGSMSGIKDSMTFDAKGDDYIYTVTDKIGMGSIDAMLYYRFLNTKYADFFTGGGAGLWFYVVDSKRPDSLVIHEASYNGDSPFLILSLGTEIKVVSFMNITFEARYCHYTDNEEKILVMENSEKRAVTSFKNNVNLGLGISFPIKTSK